MRGKIALLLTITLAFLCGGGVMYYLTMDNTNDNQVVVNNDNTKCNVGVVKCSNEIKIDETGISTAVGEIYEATVTIENYRNEKLNSTGSGFVYKTDDNYGYILTNHHVIEDNEKLVITMANDKQVEGTVLGSDEYLDLAVVKIDKKYVIEVAKLGSSEQTNLGDTIVTVGSPVGYEYRGTVTRGTLSGKNRMVEVTVKSLNDFVMKVHQIDAAINPGNSGGPLVNIKGEVIGINSLKLIKEEVEGMGFAIPIEEAVKYLPNLENGEKVVRPYLGVSMLDTTDTYKLYRNGIQLDDIYDGGVVVINVTKGSGAEKAGLQKGDIITKLNDKSVQNSAYLKYELFQLEPDDTVEVTYIRNKKENTVNVKLTTLAS